MAPGERFVSAELIVVVPTRSRPHNVAPLVEAFRETGAPSDGAELVFVIDRDDPLFEQYFDALGAVVGNERRDVTWLDASHHEQLVPKLNKAANYLRVTRRPFALGFMGDDHRPRTSGWAAQYVAELRDMGAGIVSCPDGYRPDDLPTQWAVTADIVETLGGRMVPAPVEHLYCDDAIRDLGNAAGCYRFRLDLLVDHLNPYAGKRAPMDAQYQRVNDRQQFLTDGRSYRTWKRNGGLAADAELVRALRARKGQP